MFHRFLGHLGLGCRSISPWSVLLSIHTAPWPISIPSMIFQLLMEHMNAQMIESEEVGTEEKKEQARLFCKPSGTRVLSEQRAKERGIEGREGG